MIKKSKVIKLKLNVDMDGMNKGSVISINTDSNKIPLKKYWRDKLKDSKIDGCCEIITSKSKPKAQEKVNDNSK